MIDSFWFAVGSGCAVLGVSGIFVVLWWLIRQKIAEMSEGMKTLATALTSLQNNFGMKVAEVQREIAKDQKEAESRFTAALKESDNRFYAYSARVSEVAEGMLKMELSIHKEFVRTEAFKEIFGDFRGEIKTNLEKHDQYDVWWPVTDNEDRQRVLDIATKNPTYGPYVTALGLSARAIAGDLPHLSERRACKLLGVDRASYR